jgi:hypothetical protein
MEPVLVPGTNFFSKPTAVTSLVGLLLAFMLSPMAHAETINWARTTNGNWNAAANWNPQDVPNETGEEAVVPAGTGTYTITIDLAPTLDAIRIDNTAATVNLGGRIITLLQPAGLSNSGLAVANTGISTIDGSLTNVPGGRIEIPDGKLLFLSGLQITNDGTIAINSTGGAGNAELRFLTTGTILSGSGEIRLQTAGTANDAGLTVTGASVTFTQAAGHTIRGEGTIEAQLINEGRIIADHSGHRPLAFTTFGKTNNALIEAIGNGLLTIGVPITQGPSGTILADAGAVELISNASITGGTLNTLNSGTIENTLGIAYLNDVRNAGYYGVSDGQITIVGGTFLQNDGTLVINSNAGTGNAELRFDTDGIVMSGTGVVLLQTAGTSSDAQLSVTGATTTMRQVATHTIRGEGTIDAQLINDGRIIADHSGHRPLALTTFQKTNNGLIEATGNGLLTIGVPIPQGPTGLILADAGAVELLSNASITGGTLNTLNGGTIENTLGIAGLNDVRNAGYYGVSDGQITIVGGTFLQNDGTLVINSNAGTGNAELRFDADGIVLRGTGDIRLQTAGTSSDAQLTMTGSGYTMRQTAGHTIHGEGNLEAQIINEGLILADNPAGRPLVFTSLAKTNEGEMRARGGGVLSVSATTTNNALASADSAGTIDIVTGTTTNNGELKANANGTVRIQSIGFQNAGTVEAMTGGLVRATLWSNHYLNGTLTGGTWRVDTNGVMRLIGANVTTNAASIILDGPNSNIYSDELSTDALAGLAVNSGAGRFEIANGRAFTAAGTFRNLGTVTIGAGSTFSLTRDYYQEAGTTAVNGVLATPDTVHVISGTLQGTGTVDAHVRNARYVNPGNSTGTLTIDGSYLQTADGYLEIELEGPEAGRFDRLVVTGHATLAGKLYVLPEDVSDVADGQTFEVMRFASRTGQFSQIMGCPRPGICVTGAYTDTSVVVTVHRLAPTGVETPAEDVPESLTLSARRGPGSALEFELGLPSRSQVVIRLFDVAGRAVGVIADGIENPGSHLYHWSARDLTSGIYFARADVRGAGTGEYRTARIIVIH